MNHTKHLLILCSFISYFGMGVTSAKAAFVFYRDRASFVAANPGLPVEDFEEAKVVHGSMAFMPSGLTGNTSNGTFSYGDILDGIEFRSGCCPDSMGFFALGEGGVGPPTTSKVLGETYFVDSLDTLFGPAVNAVGMDVSVAGANRSADKITASIFGLEGPLGELSLPAQLPDNAIFFGVSSDVPIIRINLADNAAADAEIIDNVAFGIRSVVPEPSGLAVMESAIVLLCLLGKAQRRKQW